MEEALSLSECYLPKNRSLSHVAHIRETCSCQRRTCLLTYTEFGIKPITDYHTESPELTPVISIYPDGWSVKQEDGLLAGPRDL